MRPWLPKTAVKNENLPFFTYFKNTPLSSPLPMTTLVLVAWQDNWMLRGPCFAHFVDTISIRLIPSLNGGKELNPGYSQHNFLIQEIRLDGLNIALILEGRCEYFLRIFTSDSALCKVSPTTGKATVEFLHHGVKSRKRSKNCNSCVSWWLTTSFSSFSRATV